MRSRVKTGASSNSVVTLPRRRFSRAAFSLPEVMVALLLVSVVCMAVIPGLQLISRTALDGAIRSEAHRLVQAEAERLMSVGFASFQAAADRSVQSCVKTNFKADSSAKYEYPSSSAGRVTFTTRTVEVSSGSTSRTLRVEVQWTWQGKTVVVSTPVFRST